MYTDLAKILSIFEDKYECFEAATVSEAMLKDISRFYEALMKHEQGQIRIAYRRLNLCYLRDDEEDAILDATIALEALLTGNERNEITHKLALRLAALSTLSSDNAYSKVEIFGSIKKIYEFRSAVVHGSSRLDKKRIISVRDNAALPAVSLATDYLRMALKTLINHPQYLDPRLIDKELLLNA